MHGIFATLSTQVLSKPLRIISVYKRSSAVIENVSHRALYKVLHCAFANFFGDLMQASK